MKKIIATLLTLILIFAMFSCSAGTSADVDGTTASDTTAPADDTTSAESGESDETDRYVYEHVIIVGVDGAGQFIRDAETPNFDRIFENGSVTYGAYSSDPTISAQSWGSMFTGVKPSLHGRTNYNLETEKYPVAEFPTLYKRISDAHPDAVLGSYCDWEPITLGLIEEGIECRFENCRDDYLGRFIKRFIVEDKPEFLFIQFDSVDAAGHASGYGSQAQLDRLKVVDGYINDVYSAIEEAGIADSTLFIVVSDHGGTYSGEGEAADHGNWTDREKYITVAATGKNVKKGEMGYANIRDISAIVLYALGIEAPELDVNGWTSQVPENLFDEKDVPAYDRSIYTEDGSDAK